MNRLFIPMLLLGIIICACPAAAGERTIVYLGEARNDDGELVYRERHTTTYDGDRIFGSVTSYLDPEGREIATMASDYGRSLALPTYLFKDARRNCSEGLRFNNGTYIIFHEEEGRDEKTKPLGDRDNVFSCQGWHYHLVENLDRVLADESLEVRLIFPNELDTYTFRIQKMSADGEVVRVKLRLANWLFSLFAPHLELVYDRATKRLVEYHGISNILAPDGEYQDVHITYTYPSDS